MTLSIGDSTAYVFNREKGVFELTHGARDLNNDRDMRNVGGALGYVYGIKPDASNLNYSLMYIREKDIVFLVSDGVSDNLDPIVSQVATRKSTDNEQQPSSGRSPTKTGNKLNRSSSQSFKQTNKRSFLAGLSNEKQERQHSPIKGMSVDDQSINLSTLPQMSPYERFICSLAHMNEILLRNKTLNEQLSAQETCNLSLFF
jgi:serine/threonine protein phosphatase PrpC